MLREYGQRVGKLSLHNILIGAGSRLVFLCSSDVADLTQLSGKNKGKSAPDEEVALICYP